jgi:hypothetical protein
MEMNTHIPCIQQKKQKPSSKKEEWTRESLLPVISLP